MLFRALRDFLQGFRVLHFVGPCVTIFGSARFGESHPFYAVAAKRGAASVELGFTVMTGGGPGLMEAANRGAKDAGGLSVGCNIELPMEQEPNPLSRPVGQTATTSSSARSCSSSTRTRFVALPGGLGTLDELCRSAHADPDAQDPPLSGRAARRRVPGGRSSIAQGDDGGGRGEPDRPRSAAGHRRSRRGDAHTSRRSRGSVRPAPRPAPIARGGGSANAPSGPTSAPPDAASPRRVQSNTSGPRLAGRPVRACRLPGTRDYGADPRNVKTLGCRCPGSGGKSASRPRDATRSPQSPWPAKAGGPCGSGLISRTTRATVPAAATTGVDVTVDRLELRVVVGVRRSVGRLPLLRQRDCPCNPCTCRGSDYRSPRQRDPGQRRARFPGT